MNNTQEIDKNVSLEQWKVCVEMADSISRRRDTMNNIFVTLNLAIIAAVSALGECRSIVIIVTGIVLSVLWILFICNYGKLNSSKFEVINRIEDCLPFQPFSEEWVRLKEKAYIKGTTLELFLPASFIVLYSVILVRIRFI